MKSKSSFIFSKPRLYFSHKKFAVTRFLIISRRLSFSTATSHARLYEAMTYRRLSSLIAMSFTTTTSEFYYFSLQPNKPSQYFIDADIFGCADYAICAKSRKVVIASLHITISTMPPTFGRPRNKIRRPLAAGSLAFRRPLHTLPRLLTITVKSRELRLF